MKIIDEFYNESEIVDFINNLKPKNEAEFKVEKLKHKSGWVYISAKNDEKEFSINYSAAVFDTADLIQFFGETVKSQEKSAIFLDYEGSNPLLYIEPISEDKVRFLFAHDYDLFLNDNIDNYSLNDYKIECDIVIDTKILLSEFYNVLIQYIQDKKYEEFNTKKAKKYKNIIKEYINKS